MFLIDEPENADWLRPDWVRKEEDSIYKALKRSGKKQALLPRGRPLSPFTSADTEVSEEEIDAAVKVWDENPKLPEGLLEAKAAGEEEAG